LVLFGELCFRLLWTFFTDSRNPSCRICAAPKTCLPRGCVSRPPFRARFHPAGVRHTWFSCRSRRLSPSEVVREDAKPWDQHVGHKMSVPWYEQPTYTGAVGGSSSIGGLPSGITSSSGLILAQILCGRSTMPACHRLGPDLQGWEEPATILASRPRALHEPAQCSTLFA